MEIVPNIGGGSYQIKVALIKPVPSVDSKMKLLPIYSLNVGGHKAFGH